MILMTRRNLAKALLLAIVLRGASLAQPTRDATQTGRPEPARKAEELLEVYDEEFTSLDPRKLAPEQERRYQERLDKFWKTKDWKEEDVVALLDELAKRKGFGVASPGGLSKQEQKEALRISSAFANAKRHLKGQVWKEVGMSFPTVNREYLRIIQDNRLSDGLRTSFLMDVDRYLQETKPRVYEGKAKPVRDALLKLVNDPACKPSFRAQALRTVSSRFRDGEVYSLIRKNVSSPDRDLRSRALYALRYLPVNAELLQQLKEAYEAESARDPELAYVVITTLRRLPGERRTDVLPVLKALRDGETNADLKKKLEWAIWALETEAHHEKERR